MLIKHIYNQNVSPTLTWVRFKITKSSSLCTL